MSFLLPTLGVGQVTLLVVIFVRLPPMPTVKVAYPTYLSETGWNGRTKEQRTQPGNASFDFRTTTQLDSHTHTHTHSLSLYKVRAFLNEIY